MIDLIFNLIKRSYRKIRFFIRVYIIKNPETINIDKWFLSNGDKTLRLIYPLSNKSVVFDLGGFRGDWTNEIVKKYNSLIHVYEPVPEYFENIKKRFHNYSNIYVYNY